MLLMSSQGTPLGMLSVMYRQPISNVAEVESMVKIFVSRAAAELERRQSREEMNHSLSILQATLDSTADGILVVDTSWQIKTFNRKFLEMWRIPGDLMTSGDARTPRDFVLEQLENPQQFNTLLESQFDDGTGETFDHVHFKDGRVFERHSQPQYINGVLVGRVWCYSDVTERVRAGEEIARSRDFYLSIFEKFPALIWRSGLDGQYDYFNRSWLEFTGRSLSEELGDGWLQGVHPEDRQRYLRTYLDSFSVRRPFEMEYRLRRHDGQYRWLVDFGRPFDDLEGRFGGYVGACFDITDRKQTEHRNSQTLSLLGATLEATADGILVVDRKGRITLHNRKLIEMWGLPEGLLEQGDGREVWGAVRSLLKTSPMFMNKMKRLHRTPEKEYFVQVRLRDGRIFECYTCPQRVGKAIMGRVWCFRDITGQKTLETQLGQMQKIEAIGNLAGGVAHDFNNLLTIINGYSAQLMRALRDDGKLSQKVDLILQAGERAAGLTRQLLAFSRQQVLEPRVVDLNGLIRNLEKMLSRLIREDITIELNLCQDLGRVKADPGQMEQILMNLTINARDAIIGPGRITIQTANAELDQAFARSHPGAVPGRYAMFAVSDTGEGIDEAIQTRIFDPFFTTKEPGRGTGLGLSTVYGIVKQSAGYISVESASGEGTSFQVFIPRTEGRSNGSEPSAEKKNAPPPRGERILLVEDQSEVLQLAEQTLTDLGYSVVPAASGEEALRRSSAAGVSFDLLVTDIVMSGMDGIELAGCLREKIPGLPVLFMSGYGDFHGRKDFSHAGNEAFLQKPFTAEVFLRKVRQLIGKTHAGKDYVEK